MLKLTVVYPPSVELYCQMNSQATCALQQCLISVEMGLDVLLSINPMQRLNLLHLALGVEEALEIKRLREMQLFMP